MADFADIAQAREELDRQAAIRAARSADPILPDIGACFNCETRLQPGMRFCDSDCRDDYMFRRNAEVRRGRD